MRQRKIYHLIGHYKNTNYLLVASHELGIDVINTYANQTNVVDKYFIWFDELDSQISLVACFSRVPYSQNEKKDKKDAL